MVPQCMFVPVFVSPRNIDVVKKKLSSIRAMMNGASAPGV